MQAILSKQAWEANNTLLCTLSGYGIRNLGAYRWNWFYQHQVNNLIHTVCYFEVDS
ncbi:hypothetical protein MKX01_039763, partial [Papaver californicum]